EEYVQLAGSTYVDVRVTVDWRERLKLLKLRWQTDGRGEATYEIPYGHVVRPDDGTENPAQSWVSCGGLAVATNAKVGHDVEDGCIGVTALRSPVYAWHEPKELDPDGIYEYMDQGLHEFTVRLVPHDGDWRDAGVVRLAAELNQPPWALLESFHAGPLPRVASFASDGGGDVVVTVVKQSEDDPEAIVVRAYESAGRPAQTRIAVL